MSEVLPPPPPTRSSGDGCWKWGAISCLGGCLLLVLVVAVGIFFFARSDLFKQAMKGADLQQRTTRNIYEIKNAIDKYRNEHNGKYPDDLQSLIPKYLASEQILKPTPDGSGPPIVYHKPPKDAPDTFA